MFKRVCMDIGSFFVKLGKSLMLPIAVLPIAGLLLRLGQPDLLDIAFMSAAGQAVFNNLSVPARRRFRPLWAISFLPPL